MPVPTLSADRPGSIAERLLYRSRRVLVYGESGIGKSTLVTVLAQWLARAGIGPLVIGADPGSPAFGIPGAVGLARWQGDGLDLLDVEGLCSLNAGRFRLPLIQAVKRLAASSDVPLLLVDAPGVVRGVAGAELLAGLIEACAADTVLLVVGEGKPAPMMNELNAAGVDIQRVAASARARSPGRVRRMGERTALWDAHLAGAPEARIPLDRYPLVGTPPPAPDACRWRGRQIALQERGRTLAMGEVTGVREDDLLVRLPGNPTSANQLLVRDAARNEEGFLTTLHPPPPVSSRFCIPTHGLPDADRTAGPLPQSRLGRLTAVMINGLSGDPLLHLRLQNRRRSLLFDLGEGRRLPARIAHQVSDIFISHAHLDHISGFFWLLRSRIGDLPACRIYGPPGLSGHLAGMIAGVHWDRIGRRGPVFEVFELQGELLERFRLQAGAKGIEPMGQRPASGGLLVDDPAFMVRAATLDHGTPVLALAFERKPEHHVRIDALGEMGFPPGPWLGVLKHRIAGGEREGDIALPDGRRAPLTRLAEALICTTPGGKLVYATDLADTPANRETLTRLAHGAQTFFCEAGFLEEHRSLAVASGHLTARGCGEIAAAAKVQRLVPFHLSRRYDDRIAEVLDEIRSACPGVAVSVSGTGDFLLDK